MTALELLSIIDYCLVLIYGLFLSAFIAGGWKDKREKRLVFALCPLFLLIQLPFWLLWGESFARQIYPLIVHLPLVFILIFALKKPFGTALVSVCTAYLCCQLPHWVGLAAAAITGSQLAGKIGYTVFVFPIFYVLYRFFVRPAHDAMTASPRSLALFGSLPVAFYFFDYATTVYADALAADVAAINEFLPTALLIFYVIFLSAYHRQMQTQADAELQRSMLEAELKQSEIEVDGLRSAESQVAVYQHDMRHHLGAIDAFLAAQEPEQARAYIRRVCADTDAVMPRRYCANSLVNLLISSFAQKAEKQGITLEVRAELPRELTLPDTELCSILSNGLENALHAAAELPAAQRSVSLYCGLRRNNLLIEITNPYAGGIAMREEMPVSAREGHGYGCRSIRDIAGRRHGLCTFEPKDGVFVLRVAIPNAAVEEI